MAKYDEIEVMQRAYDELKALDREGQIRALTWLSERLAGDYEAAMKAREQAAKDRIASRRGASTK